MIYHKSMKMIISIIQTKGGTGKNTLARCLAHSKAIRYIEQIAKDL